jgi:hypothetical protein
MALQVLGIDLTHGRTVSLSSSMCLSADVVAVSHSISLIHIVHVRVIILHNEWFRSVFLFIAEITFGWCIMNIHQHSIQFISLSIDPLEGVNHMDVEIVIEYINIYKVQQYS